MLIEVIDKLLELLIDSDYCVIRFPRADNLLGNIPTNPVEQGISARSGCDRFLGSDVQLRAWRFVKGYLFIRKSFGHNRDNPELAEEQGSALG